jgi:hypothetical protein
MLYSLTWVLEPTYPSEVAVPLRAPNCQKREAPLTESLARGLNTKLLGLSFVCVWVAPAALSLSDLRIQIVTSCADSGSYDDYHRNLRILNHLWPAVSVCKFITCGPCNYADFLSSPSAETRHRTRANMKRRDVH